MIAWWTTIQSIRWLPYALGAVALLVLVWRIWDSGHDSGYNVSQAIVAEAEAATMRRHINQAAQVAKSDLEAVVVTATKKEAIRYAYKNIVRTVDTCNSADWLREYNESVRAAGTGAYTSGIDPTPDSLKGSVVSF